MTFLGTIIWDNERKYTRWGNNGLQQEQQQPSPTYLPTYLGDFKKRDMELEALFWPRRTYNNNDKICKMARVFF